MTQKYKRYANSQRALEMPSWSIKSVTTSSGPNDAPLNCRLARPTERDARAEPEDDCEPLVALISLSS
jgi:hypothetical protein